MRQREREQGGHNENKARRAGGRAAAARPAAAAGGDRRARGCEERRGLLRTQQRGQGRGIDTPSKLDGTTLPFFGNQIEEPQPSTTRGRQQLSLEKKFVGATPFFSSASSVARALALESSLNPATPPEALLASRCTRSPRPTHRPGSPAAARRAPMAHFPLLAAPPPRPRGRPPFSCGARRPQ